jgi:hypothetical protein
MKRRMSRWAIWICFGLSGTVFQFPITGSLGIGGGGCTTFATTGALNSVDFCAIFDCENGFFGGTVQPCGTQSTGGQPLLVDCPGAEEAQ